MLHCDTPHRGSWTLGLLKVVAVDSQSGSHKYQGYEGRKEGAEEKSLQQRHCCCLLIRELWPL